MIGGWWEGEVERSSSGSTLLRRSSVEGGPAPSIHLLNSLANEYSLYLKTDLSTQICKVEEFLGESVAKLEEFHSLYEMKESERRAWLLHVLPDLIRTATLLSVTLNQRLDTVAALISSIQITLDTLEGQVSRAEVKLGLPSPSTGYDIRSVFKYFKKTEEPEVDPPTLASGKKPNAPSSQQLHSQNPLQLAQFFH